MAGAGRRVVWLFDYSFAHDYRGKRNHWLLESQGAPSPPSLLIYRKMILNAFNSILPHLIPGGGEWNPLFSHLDSASPHAC